MIKIILFDCDGLIIRHEKYFSIRLAAEKGIHLEDENNEQKDFFNGIFIDCELGKADLKKELQERLDMWQWTGTVEQLMDYWFSGEAHIIQELKDYILSLRVKGFKCFLATNNEKYRTEYLWNVASLKNIFDGLFASSSIGHFKESPMFWEKVYSNFPEFKKEEILVWDDDEENIISARKFGFNAEHYVSFENFKQTMKEKYQLND